MVLWYPAYSKLNAPTLFRPWSEFIQLTRKKFSYGFSKDYTPVHLLQFSYYFYSRYKTYKTDKISITFPCEWFWQNRIVNACVYVLALATISTVKRKSPERETKYGKRTIDEMRRRIFIFLFIKHFSWFALRCGCWLLSSIWFWWGQAKHSRHQMISGLHAKWL